MSETTTLGIKEIVRAAGGPMKIAAALGLDHSAISKWRQVPVHHVIRIAEMSGISIEEILAIAVPPGQRET